MRDSPALDLIPALQALGATVQAFDPEGREAEALLPGVDFKSGPYEAITGADVMVLLTEWDQFRALDLDHVRGLMRAPVVVDLRNVYRPDEVRQRGFAYSSIGRP
jgi:UDPglucose 6-dehydrogenase